VRAAAEKAGVQLIVPRPGGRVDVLDPPELTDWWTAVGSEADAERRPSRTTTRTR
jgi:hypothetical protein